MSETESKLRGRLMYQSHPSRDSVFTRIPQNLVQATQNIQQIKFEDLEEMHGLIWELASIAAEWQPDLIPFFATGGIPYLFPMMRALDGLGHRNLTDGNHFHLYPGLSWDGAIDAESAESYFVSSFGKLIRSSIDVAPVRILVIDTTNTGNAVNKAIGACQQAVKESEVATDLIAMRIIGVVNTSHPESQNLSENKSTVNGTIKHSHVITPSSVRFSAELHDRQFIKSTFIENEYEFSFELSYWLAGNVPTEDNAELIGVKVVHKELTTNSNASPGRLEIAYKNGETQQGIGIVHLPGRFISLLAMPLDAWQWEKMRQIDQLPPLSDEERESCDKIKEISDAGLRLFELMSMDPLEAINGLKMINRPLTTAEVYWLGTIDPPPQDIAKKVCDSLEKGCCTSGEALKYFVRAFPNLVDLTSDKITDSWWIEKIRSLSKDSLMSFQQGTGADSRTSSDELGSCRVDEFEDDEENLVLDFVVIVGGVEQARKLLAEQQAKGLSILQIQEYLKETWPIAVENPFTFDCPTNDQVALDFVLNCGGWEQAFSCLDEWIAQHSG